MKIVHVALDVPIDDGFDFLADEAAPTTPGTLVIVPFGKTRKVGVVVAEADHSDIPRERLRPIESVVPDVPAFRPGDLDLFRFCASYYQRPLGEVIAASLPPRLRQTRRRPLKAPDPRPANAEFLRPVELGPEQLGAIQEVLAARDRFHPVLLQGVTGSGKTEVYLHLVADAIARGKQALILVPEIGLTPQFESQVRARFPGATVLAAHSGLPQGERAATWLAAQAGAAQVVLGTRLAVLMPFRDLGLMVVDEEHDPSYKQQEGMRYSARDVAVRRAQRLGIPVVLGSATPSLESLLNAREGRYAHLRLTTRAVAGSRMPLVRTVDTRADRPRDGISHALLLALKARLERGEQALVFINRRGFAPVLHCPACAWHSTCTRCSANLVLHRRDSRLQCHHCGHRERVPTRCPSCGAEGLAPIGQGTQRIEETLADALPGARIARIDRDSTARQGSLEAVLQKVRDREIDLLVGTQMLAKGHDYPALTLVGVVGADSALFSADFRAGERLHALLVQVAGRAGRGRQAGEVLIQTDFPGHPLFAAVARHDFDAFADVALGERRLASFPPYAYLAVLRAESKSPGEALRFLESAVRLAPQREAVLVFDPVAAPMERKAGFERAQLLVRATERAALQPFLGQWRRSLEAQGQRRVRWTLDVDPQEA